MNGTPAHHDGPRPGRRLSTATAVLASSVLLSMALVGNALLQRYQLAATDGGMSVRLDRFTGEVVACVPWKDELTQALDPAHMTYLRVACDSGIAP
jgi:hypothetical protein